MRYCEKCGNPMPDGDKFCQKCGAALENANPFEEIINPVAQQKIKKQPLHTVTWFIILWCILFPPAGIIMVWLKKEWTTKTKIIICCVSTIWLINAVIRGQTDNTLSTALICVQLLL